MASNSFGTLFTLTTFGESHGPAVGGVIDGVPAGLKLDMEGIAEEMARRRPGQSAISTQRSEQDIPEFLSGLLDGVTTGAPIAFIIPSKDSRSSDYDKLKEVYRPGHADFTYEQKYGIRDHRGGGRSSARTMAPWVCAGAIARQILSNRGITIRAYVTEIGGISLPQNVQPDYSLTESNAVRCPHEETAEKMERAVREAKENGDSLGGVVRCEVLNLPAGIGEPQFGKMPAMLAHAMMSINAVKGFEMGEGFALARMKGSEANDLFRSGAAGVETNTNRSGGVLGGISNGMPLWFRVAFKPTSSISIPQTTLTTGGEETELSTTGRHDPCVVPRAVPIVEAMAALVLVDLWMIDKARK